MAQRRRAEPKQLDPLRYVSGDPQDIREAAQELYEAWRGWVAAGHEDDGRFEPLQKVFAPSDRDVITAAEAVKWVKDNFTYERNVNPPHIAKLQQALRSALIPPDWYDKDQARKERLGRRSQLPGEPSTISEQTASER